MTMFGLFLFILTVAVAAARPSHFSSFEGHGVPSEPKLISESVHLRDIPTKVIKVTKTAVVKVPVPYPVKVPFHVAVKVPVPHPFPYPVTKFLKVHQQVPVEVPKPVPIPIQNDVPIVVAKPIPIPHPIPVGHPVEVPKPVFVPVPHPIPHHIPHPISHQVEVHGEEAVGDYHGGNDHIGHESSAYGTYAVNNEQNHGIYDQQSGDQGHFQPSQPDYNGGH